jgi:hypothetical protein
MTARSIGVNRSDFVPIQRKVLSIMHSSLLFLLLKKIRFYFPLSDCEAIRKEGKIRQGGWSFTRER